MITYLNKNISWILSLLIVSTITISCDQEDYAGFATLDPTSPTLSIATQVQNASLIEDDSEYTFTATLSTVQLVDVKLYITQVSGDATIGADFEVTESLVIPAGSTSATGKIKILSDELIEGTEKVKIQIGDVRTANATITPKTMEFTILNYTSGDLALKMDWALAAIATDNSGNEISATAFADMRLLISKQPNNLAANIIGEADGSGFESFVLSSTTPDGTYYVVADFYAANKTIVRDLNLSLTLNQAGVINNSVLNYNKALSNLGTCNLNFYILTKVVKVGNTYTLTDVSTQSYTLAAFVPWVGTDADYPSKVTTKAICDGLFIKGLNAEWMFDWWGEIVTKETPLFASIDASGNVTIAQQPLYETTWNGAVQAPYFVKGTGTYNAVTGNLYIKYTLWQGAGTTKTDITKYIYDQGWWPTPYMEATLTK